MPWGVDPEPYGFDEDYLNKIIKIESGGNPNARTGSYRGLFQLSDDEFYNKWGGTGNIFDPKANTQAALKKLSAERDNFRKKYDREPSPTDLYLIHQQGEGGYEQHASNPEGPAWKNMLNTAEGRQKGPRWAQQAIWGNIPDADKRRFGSIENVSSQDFMDLWKNRVEGGSTVASERPTGLPEQAEAASGSPAGSPQQAEDETGAVAQGNRRMADDAGLLTRLGYQPQEQMGGILGGMGGGGFESKLPYLAMIAKGLSPYSDLDPMSLMKLAQAQQERAIMNQYRQQQMDISRSAEDRHKAEFGFRQNEQLERQDERRQKLQQEQEARQSETTIFDEASKSEEGGGLTRQQIYDYRKTHPNLTPRTEKMLNDRLTKLDAIDEKRGESDRDWNDRAQRAKKLGLEENTSEWQKYMANNKISDEEKAIPGDLSGRMGLSNVYLRHADKLREDIAAEKATGLYDVTMGKLGLGEQGEIHRKVASGVDALRRMLTGAGMPASEADEYVERYRPTLRDNSTSLLSKHDQLVEELTEQRRLAMRGRGKDPGVGGPEKGSVGGSGTLDEARQAIQRGAPRDKVIERLRKMGVDPGGL